MRPVLRGKRRVAKTTPAASSGDFSQSDVFAHGLSDHHSSRVSLTTDKANHSSCGWSSLSGPHATVHHSSQVSLGTDKANHSGCEVVIVERTTCDRPLVSGSDEGLTRQTNGCEVVFVSNRSACRAKARNKLILKLTHWYSCIHVPLKFVSVCVLKTE